MSLTAIWYAADVAERMHLLRPEEEVRGLPRLQIHYEHGDREYPMDLTVELISVVEDARRQVTWRVTKNYTDFGDWFHLFLEPHPI